MAFFSKKTPQFLETHYIFLGGNIYSSLYSPFCIQGNDRKETEAKLERFFNSLDAFDLLKRRILIFHCEFSSERGPNMYQQFRIMDRRRNQYPTLCWPEMYILKGIVAIL